MREPLLVVLDLAEDRDDRDQQAGVLEDREGRRRADASGSASYAVSAARHLGRGLAVVAGEAGVGDRAHRAIIPSRAPT